MNKALGILLTNTGTPDSHSVEDVRVYLKTFLSDPRVVRIPRIIWKPLLNGVILPRRAAYAAGLYKKIWTEQGSPLRFNTENLAVKLNNYLNGQFDQPVYVEVGMHYGNPSIPQAIAKLKARDIQQLIILPLFPQYSTSTTETTRDQTEWALKMANDARVKQAAPGFALGNVLPCTRLLPSLARTSRCQSQEPPASLGRNVFEMTASFVSFVSFYAEHPGYIEALARQIRRELRKDHYLLFSFHGLPQRFVDKGDPYPLQCQQTASRVAEALKLSGDEWSIAYQSRFGYAKWLSPYTFETLQGLPAKGVRRVSVVCPGFSVDCMETLEEIQIRGKEEFLKFGGESYHYIPALNDTEEHAQALGDIVKEAIGLENS